MKIFLKLLTLWAFVINSAFGQGDPAPFIKGMGSTGLGNSASTILVPNNQSTKINAYQALIETGNTNLLVNSGFEHSIPTTGWTLTNATAAVNTTNKLEGAKALQVTPTVAGGGIKQIITLNASNLLGSQGVIEVPVRTSGTDVKVCFLANSVRTYCKDVPAFDASSAFKTIVTPITFDGTSNGIEVYSTGTSVFIVDEIKIGRGLPLQSVNGAKQVGNLKYIGANLCEWQLTSSTFANFSADTDCATPTVTGTLKAPATKIPAVVLPSGSQAGTYYFVAKGMFYNSTGNYGTWRFSDGTNSSDGNVGYQNTNSIGSVVGSITYLAALSSDTTINIQNKNNGGASFITANTTSDGLGIEVYYFPPESKIYSQASQDYDWTSYTPTFTGFGTVTNATFWHKREGSDLLIRGNFQTGTLTATTPSLTLPNGLSIDTTKIPSVVSLCSISQRGISATTGSQYTNYTAINPSTPTVLKFATGNNGLTGTNEITNATISFGNGEWQSISTCRIPISGWQDYGVIVGRFTDTVNDTGSVKPISKKAALTCTSSSAIISQGLGSSWITSIGNIASGACAVAITSGIFNSTPLCQITPRGNLASTTTWKITESSNTSISLYCTSGGSNCTGGENVNIVCEGLGI